MQTKINIVQVKSENIQGDNSSDSDNSFDENNLIPLYRRDYMRERERILGRNTIML